MNIVDRERVAGGWAITVEVPNAYTDGSSRLDRVYLRDQDVRGKGPEQVAQAIQDALDDDPLAQLVGQPVAALVQTRAVLEDRMVALYEAWQRWQRTRAEAQARGLPLAVVTALTAREAAAWAAYVDAISGWRTAPT